MSNTIKGLLLDAFRHVADGRADVARPMAEAALRAAMLDASIPAHKVAAISRAVSAIAAI